MADRIKGITIEIGGDTSKLQSSLKGVDKQLRETQSNLNDINKLLKLDPGNVELLTQKQKNLKNAIEATKERLETLKDAQKGVAEGSAEWDNLQREIIATEQSLDGLQREYKNFGSVAAQQIKAAGQAMKDFGGKVEEAGDKFKGISTAAGGIATALVGLGYKAVTSADDLATLAQQTGLSVEELQKMQYATDFVDVSLDDMTSALKKTKSAMTGHDELWESLGISVKDADGNMRDASAVFYESLDALSKIENETERDQKAMELFGKSADQLAGIIDDGGKGLKEYGEEAEELGIVLGKDTVDGLAELNSELDRVKKLAAGSLGKLGATVAKSLAPALQKVSGLMDKVSEKLSKLTPQQTETILKIVGIVAAIAPALKVGGKLIKVIGSVTSVIGTVVGVLGGPLTLAIGAVIAVGVLLWKNWDKIKAAAQNLFTNLKATWNNIKSTITSTMDTVKSSVSKAWDNIKTTASTAANNVKTSVSNAWNNVKAVSASAWNAVKATLQTKWNAIKSAYEAHGGGLKGVAAAAVQGIKEYFSTGFDALNALLGGKLTTIKNAVSTAWNNIKSTTESIWNGIKNSISSKITSAKNTVSTMIDRIKGFLSFEWKLPTLKLPHVILTKGEWPWGLMGQGVPPKVSISWYKKAYDNPLMFTAPTVMATPNGYKGFGDGHGAEIVLGLNKLRELVGSTGNTINVYAAPGQSAEEIAYKVQEILVNQQMQRSRAYA